MKIEIPTKTAVLFIAGACCAAFALTSSMFFIEVTSETSFCVLCHEMKVVAEQGWKRSPHYSNEQGVVAQCSDCHVPPELIPKLWTKTRDGVKDVAVHTFGESNPEQMPWDELTVSARRKIFDSACMKCHENLTPKGAPIKVIIAHRAYLRMKDEKKCLECHRESFHGDYREYLNMPDNRTKGETL